MRPLVIVASIATFIVAAKAHGLQLRLEREAAGYFAVQFGGSNPPFVEALWRRERLWFWPSTLTLGALFVIYAVCAARTKWPTPLGTGPLGLLLPLVWIPTIAFIVLGLLSLARTRQTNVSWWIATT